jgi:hypothetical protein
MIFTNDMAINSMLPEAQFVSVDGVIEWHSEDIAQPTGAEITAEVIRLQAEYDSNGYARNRLEAYNALNQFELISDDSINGTTTHKDAILAIKAKFPKP